MAREHEDSEGVKPSKTAAVRARVEDWQHRLESYEHVPVVGVGFELERRDRSAQGAVIGSAIAFRMFLFFVPLLLFLVGIVGLLKQWVSTSSVNSTTGISGGLAEQMNTALNQPGHTRWVAIGAGLVGMISAGRSLSKVLWAASTAVWKLPPSSKAPLKIAGGLSGLIAGIALIAVLVNRIHKSLGIGVAGVSFIVAFVLYLVAWLAVALLLPRGTPDRGAALPGAVLVALTITVMQAVSQLYLPGRFNHASQLYGAIGTTVVTLGWFFFIGRAIALALVLDVVIYERFGGIAAIVFSWPVLRVLARKSPHVRRFFGLEDSATVDQSGSIGTDSP